MENPIDYAFEMVVFTWLLIFPFACYLLNDVPDTFFWLLFSGGASLLVALFVSPFVLIFLYFLTFGASLIDKFILKNS